MSPIDTPSSPIAPAKSVLPKTIARRWISIAGTLGVLIGFLGLALYLALQRPHTYAQTPMVNPQGSTTIISLDNVVLSHTIQAALDPSQTHLVARFDQIVTTTHANGDLDVSAIAHLSLVNFVTIFTFSPTVDQQTGLIKSRLVESQIGRLPLPGVEFAVEAAIDHQLALLSTGPLPTGLTYKVVAVNVTENAMIITAKLAF